MASTSNNSGISGNVEDFGPDEKWDDETKEEYNERMRKKAEAKEKQRLEDLRRMPPCLG